MGYFEFVFLLTSVKSERIKVLILSAATEQEPKYLWCIKFNNSNFFLPRWKGVNFSLAIIS